MVDRLILDSVFCLRRIVVYKQRVSRLGRLLLTHRAPNSLASACKFLVSDELGTVEADVITALCAAHDMIVPVHAYRAVVFEYRSLVLVLWSNFTAEDLVFLLCIRRVDDLVIRWCELLLQLWMNL